MNGTKYSKEFKADALRLSEREGVKEASEKLGISPRHIYDWRRDERLKRKSPIKTAHPGETLQEANKRLEKEYEELREANHILKKALGFMAGR